MMQATCLRSASRSLYESFFSSSVLTPSIASRTTTPSLRLRTQAKQRQLHTGSTFTLFTNITTKQASRFAPTSTQTTLKSCHRHETTSAASPSSPSPPTALTWNDFFRLRQRRRYINVGSSILTASATLVGGFGFVAAQDLESLQFFGLDPIISSSLVCLTCAAGGWLAGPLLGSIIFRVLVGRMGEIGAKEKDFYSRIRRYRVDPSNSSVQNPVPDYYGEKITSVRGYRQWLKDQKAFRRKRESML